MEPSQPQPQNQPQAAGTDQQQYVYVTRPIQPRQPELTPEIKQKHEASKQQYPFLNLSEGEFVISAVDRHPIGILQIWAVVAVVIAAVVAVTAFLASGMQDSTSAMKPEILAIPALLVAVLALLFGFIATSIYNANTFFLTNESVIQYIQTGIFAKRQQTVSLSNIEDASYTQHGIAPTIFNYGLIRLSTEGDETTYRFNYASRPEKQVALLNNAVESFKNGRPIVTH